MSYWSEPAVFITGSLISARFLVSSCFKPETISIRRHYGFLDSLVVYTNSCEIRCALFFEYSTDRENNKLSKTRKLLSQSFHYFYDILRRINYRRREPMQETNGDDALRPSHISKKNYKTSILSYLSGYSINQRGDKSMRGSEFRDFCEGREVNGGIRVYRSSEEV